MNQNWSTKNKDMQIAKGIIDQYVSQKNVDTLGLFELVVSQREKKMSFRLAHWVVKLAERFNAMYGAQQGDYVTRQVISKCMRQDQVLH